MAQQTNNSHAGEIQTLRSLITKYDELPTYIIIPKIQRDYAQGRVGKESLRKNFLNDLFEVIDTTHSVPRLYDYIYGQLEKPNPDHPESYYFYPVDGQQRLTTMFLLHLYIGKRAGQHTDFLKYFSYQTRNSSKLFCEMLCGIESKEFADIISYIKDSDRFTSHWNNDPTISSMMRMLEDIHQRFKIKGSLCTQAYFEQCWNNLVKNVQFWMLNLSDLETTDDIYIKMNSRGKGLTPFENFKAELDNLVATKGQEFVEGEYTMQIDTTWTNLFWNYRDKSLDLTETDLANTEALDYTDNGLDNKMLNFFRNYFVLLGLKTGELSCSKEAEKLSAIELAERVVESSPKIFNEIKSILDFFSEKQKNGIEIRNWFAGFLTAIPEEKRFEKDKDSLDVRINPNPLSTKDAPIDYLALFMRPQVTMNEKLFAEGLFYLILNRPLVFEAMNHEDPDFENLRMLRNLIVNSEIHDDDKDYHRNSMKQNLEAVDLLMSRGLQAVKEHKSEFSGVQIEQEISKCNWLAQASIAEQVAMKQLENHSVLRGNLKVLYALSPLSLTKINNFRGLFKHNIDYDEIEQIALAYDDYGIKNGNARNYAEGTLNSWRDRIFVNSNIYSVEMFEKMLNNGAKTYQDYILYRDAFYVEANTKKHYEWPYYLSKYESMRWAPKGYYLLDGESYLYYMFNASTCIHSDTYIHYNVYNDALYCMFGEKFLSENDRGGALFVLNTGATIDIRERTVEINLTDGIHFHLEIPQNNGVDSVDRISFSKDVIIKLIVIANDGKPIDYAAVSDDDEILLKKLCESDLLTVDWPGLIRDETYNLGIEENVDIESETGTKH